MHRPAVALGRDAPAQRLTDDLHPFFAPSLVRMREM